MCPQQNVLFDLLTVHDHVLLFAGLRGLSEASGIACTSAQKCMGILTHVFSCLSAIRQAEVDAERLLKEGEATGTCTNEHPY